MTNEYENSSNNVAIVALIIVAIALAGFGFLYYKMHSGNPAVVQRTSDTTVIEKQVLPPAPAVQNPPVQQSVPSDSNAPAEPIQDNSGAATKQGNEPGSNNEGTPQQ